MKGRYTMIRFICLIASLFFVALCMLFGFMTIDLEQARQDYLKIKRGEVEYNKVIDCIYQPNCDYYNNLLKEE